MSREKFGEFGLRVETGADRSAALRQRIKILYRSAQSLDAAADLGRVAGKLLTERQRRRILGVGTANLHDIRERILLCTQRAMQFIKRGNQVGENAGRRRDMHRSR